MLSTPLPITPTGWVRTASVRTPPTSWLTGCVAIALLVPTFGCARANPIADPAAAGFWAGLLHGFIAPVSLILSLITNIGVYEVHNNGTWYNFGFIAGLALLIAAFASATGDGADAIIIAVLVLVAIGVLVELSVWIWPIVAGLLQAGR